MSYEIRNNLFSFVSRCLPSLVSYILPPLCLPPFPPTALQSGGADEVCPSVQFGGRAPPRRHLHSEFPRPQRPGGGLRQRGPRARWESVHRILPLTLRRQTRPERGLKTESTDRRLWLKNQNSFRLSQDDSRSTLCPRFSLTFRVPRGWILTTESFLIVVLMLVSLISQVSWTYFKNWSENERTKPDWYELQDQYINTRIY